MQEKTFKPKKQTLSPRILRTYEVINTLELARGMRFELIEKAWVLIFQQA